MACVVLYGVGAYNITININHSKYNVACDV